MSVNYINWSAIRPWERLWQKGRLDGPRDKARCFWHQFSGRRNYITALGLCKKKLDLCRGQLWSPNGAKQEKAKWANFYIMLIWMSAIIYIEKSPPLPRKNITLTPWLKWRESAWEGVWDPHLLISRPKDYPIVAQKPRGKIKACVIQWLLYHPRPALPLRGLLLRFRRQEGEGIHWPGPV